MLELIKNMLSRIISGGAIVCPCGFKAANKRQALKHLNTHPMSEGVLDIETDAITW